TTKSARKAPKTSTSSAEVALELLPPAFSHVPLTFVETDDVLPGERSEVLSRLLNVVVASVALLLFAPIMLLIALAIRLTSKGPVIYSQMRVGVDRRFRSARKHDRRVFDHGGRLFRMYKFRSMRVDAEADGKAVWAQK